MEAEERNEENTEKKEFTRKDKVLDTELRPKTFEEYIGQETVKQNLHILLTAAKGRDSQPEHILFYGPPGLGKTTLAHLISKSIGANMKTTSGPAIEKVGDLASILTNLEPGDILFIDEIHRLNKMIEEVLYPAMESGVIDIIIGKGPAARTIQLDLPAFTLVAATTRPALISSPLRSRFSGGSYRLENYSLDELVKIIKRSADILNIKLEDDAPMEIAKRSRSTPRTANYLLKRARDYSQVHNVPINEKTIREVVRLLEIDDFGLTQEDRNVLFAIIDKFKGGPVGINTLAAALNQEEETLEEVIEPYLLQLGFLDRTPRGRVVTDAGRDHILNS